MGLESSVRTWLGHLRGLTDFASALFNGCLACRVNLNLGQLDIANSVGGLAVLSRFPDLLAGFLKWNMLDIKIGLTLAAPLCCGLI